MVANKVTACVQATVSFNVDVGMWDSDNRVSDLGHIRAEPRHLFCYRRGNPAKGVTT